jgi:hypothetical protein
MKLYSSCFSTLLFVLFQNGLVEGNHLRQTQNEAADKDLQHTLEKSALPQHDRRLTSSSPGKHDRTLQESSDDMITSDDECTKDQLYVTVELFTDWYANETSWEIVRESDGVIVQSGYGYMNSQSYGTSMCLPKNCYKFTIHDSSGDGMCCDYGLGQYSVYTGANYDLIFSGGLFGTSESVSFGGTCQPSPDYSKKTKCANATISFTTDNSVGETYIGLFDLSGTGVNLWGGDQAFDLPNHAYTVTQCIDPTKCYEALAYDDLENGLARETFTVSYDGTLKELSGDDRLRTALIGSSCADRPLCVDLSLSLTTGSSADTDISVGLYDLTAGGSISLWYTSIDQPNQEYEWSKCIDPLRCYEVWVYSWYADSTLSSAFDAVLMVNGEVLPTNFSSFQDYFVGEGCTTLGFTNDNYY